MLQTSKDTELHVSERFGNSRELDTVCWAKKEACIHTAISKTFTRTHSFPSFLFQLHPLTKLLLRKSSKHCASLKPNTKFFSFVSYHSISLTNDQCSMKVISKSSKQKSEVVEGRAGKDGFKWEGGGVVVTKFARLGKKVGGEVCPMRSRGRMILWRRNGWWYKDQWKGRDFSFASLSDGF